MQETACDILIVGASTGGCAAALAACDMGMRVVMTEETDWVGGQLTAQIVPPDEHPWIEQFGCTARYRDYRNRVRAFYREYRPLTDAARRIPNLNPGGGWVSRICHEPSIGEGVLRDMLGQYLAKGLLTIRYRLVPVDADVDGQPTLPSQQSLNEGTGERVRSIRFLDLESGEEEIIAAKVFLDATELGDLLPMTGTSYVVGAESKSQTNEPNAVDGSAEWDNVQGITWCFAMALDEGSHRTIDRPATYDVWRAYQPEFWPGPHLGFDVLHAHTNQKVKLPLFSDHWYALFPYRQIVDPTILKEHEDPATVVNWPQNDYFLKTLLDVDDELDLATGVPLARGRNAAQALRESRDLSLCLLYWLQTEAPRHDGGVGYPGLHLRPDLTGTADGFAKTAYVRESRRIVSHRTILEQDVAAASHPGEVCAPEMEDPIGVGAYRIDLHPSTDGKNTIDASTLPFQIPLGALIPTRMRNLLPACKNIGTTHITNGCYRLHPVEWNVGEAAGLIAGLAVRMGVDPLALYHSPLKFDLVALLESQGIERAWPRLRAL